MNPRYKQFQQDVETFDHPFYILTYIRNELFALHTSVAGFAELLSKGYIHDSKGVMLVGSTLCSDMDYMRAVIEYTYERFAIPLKPDLPTTEYRQE